MPQSDAQALKRLGQAIRKERERLGLSQEWVALEAEINRGYMSDLELGKVNISILKIRKICVVLKVKPSDLLFEAGL